MNPDRGPSFDIGKLTFSRRGSFLFAGSFKRRSGRLLIGTARDNPYIDLHRQGSPREYFEMALRREGTELPYTVSADPARVELQAEGGSVRFTFADAETLVFDVRGVELVLLPCHSVVGLQAPDSRRLELPDYRGFCIQQFRCDAQAVISTRIGSTVDGLTGPFEDIAVEVSFTASSGSDRFTAALRLSRSGGLWPEPLPDFEVCRQGLHEDWSGWRGKMPEVPAHLEETAEAAWYLLWSNTAAAEGLYRREPILVSNYWFNQIYAWDNCFHAVGVVEADPELAAGQLLALYDHAGSNGALPDPLSDQRCHFGLVKPPVHGWAVLEMIRLAGRDALAPYLPELYEGMANWTDWWFTQRDSNQNGLAEYVRGMDSGWDNATPFDLKVPIEGADLAAHLVLQTEALATMAAILHRAGEARAWTTRSRNQLETLIRLRWRDGRFTSPGIKGQAAPGNSLLDRMPIELGHRLPEPILSPLLDDLRDGGSFLGRFGYATEALDSPFFNPQGYWRGPIWPSASHLIHTGLRDAKATDLAHKVAKRWCAMVAADPVFWEDYDPINGTGNDSPGMSWTAAVFIRFAASLATGSSPDRPTPTLP